MHLKAIYEMNFKDAHLYSINISKQNVVNGV